MSCEPFGTDTLPHAYMKSRIFLAVYTFLTRNMAAQARGGGTEVKPSAMLQSCTTRTPGTEGQARRMSARGLAMAISLSGCERSNHIEM